MKLCSLNTKQKTFISLPAFSVDLRVVHIVWNTCSPAVYRGSPNSMHPLGRFCIVIMSYYKF